MCFSPGLLAPVTKASAASTHRPEGAERRRGDIAGPLFSNKKNSEKYKNRKFNK